MNAGEYQRRDDRSEMDVILHCLTMRRAELEGLARTWAARNEPENTLRARPAAAKAIETARVIAGLGHEIADLGNRAVEALQLETEAHDIERGALVPGDEIRGWPDVS